jgi:hypothetical protein
MEDNKISSSASFIDCSLVEKIELALGDTHEIIVEVEKTFIVRKKPEYPKTYTECCKVLNIISGNVLLFDNSNETNNYVYGNEELYNNFDKLKVCRDAYWKLFGEQMGLDKPWSPNWEDNTPKYSIFVYKNSICTDISIHANKILVFPTKEMRDIFYKNFKEELIEKCKELL